jgi:hypothetical protein
MSDVIEEQAEMETHAQCTIRLDTSNSKSRKRGTNIPECRQSRKVAGICYGSKFLKTGVKNYAHHSLPTRARPVPADQEGKQVVDGWEFQEEKWESDGMNKSRSGVTNTNTFPDHLKGRLDHDLLKRMKLTNKWIVEGDALFFFQLLLPIGDPKKSGIETQP